MTTKKNPTPKKANAYKDEKNVSALLRSSGLSGNGLKKSTVLGKGVYSIPYTEVVRGTPIVLAFIILLGVIKEGKKFSKTLDTSVYDTGLKELKTVDNDSKVYKLFKSELSVLSKEYKNFNRLVSEIRGKILKGEILSFSFRSVDRAGKEITDLSEKGKELFNKIALAIK